MSYNETKRKEDLVGRWITLYSVRRVNTKFGEKNVYTGSYEEADITRPENYFDFFGSAVLDEEISSFPVTIKLRKMTGKSGREYYVFEKK
ncbi:MAG: hypothetical protein QXL51_07420 [Candidatus Aenigmatarchaeota archaeon]